MTDKNDNRKRWLAFAVLSLGVLMIVLDVTIVNVALPSIKQDLGFGNAALAWVVNAYLLTFGGFLMLGGRLGDLFGYRKLFLTGIVIFTISSLACGLSNSQLLLVAARTIQGIGGSLVSAVGFSLVMTMFTGATERAKAMGFFGFIAAGGGSIGVLLGGTLTSTLNWHWIFFVNIPIGIAVFALGRTLLPEGRNESAARHIDFLGAVTITAALMLAIYAIVNGNQAGWASVQTIGLLAASVLLAAIFIFVERKSHAPLMPLHIFRMRNLATANVVAILWAAGMFAWFFLSALYLQLILGYTPLQVGLSFLPANIIMGIFSLGISAKLVLKFGIRAPLGAGLALAAIGLILFTNAPLHGSFLYDVLPSMILLGVGAGMAFNPMLLAAMNDVKPHESGLASGVVNTSFMMGGALGLAVLASLASLRTGSLVAAGAPAMSALNSGYHFAFLIGGIFAALGACISFILIRTNLRKDGEHQHMMH
ncbi:MAG: MFS transporter [Candidatus Micrarchaeota archaeon]|nr:MFS transporter [Candidatus Micrarchaeota archaeon]